ncbi:hypothetical protein SDC9_88565 [bioreactor metagenome]|uniref:Uncharacterized protein n=1 Tax=bioreactor metagenome TaxID=1076179 RepID=A0A644ZLX2_9ZZZZ
MAEPGLEGHPAEVQSHGPGIRSPRKENTALRGAAGHLKVCFMFGIILTIVLKDCLADVLTVGDDLHILEAGAESAEQSMKTFRLIDVELKLPRMKVPLPQLRGHFIPLFH